MLVPMRAILEAADKYHYGQAAFNMNSVGQVQAAIRIHELLDSAAILQGAEASNAYLGGAADFMHGRVWKKRRAAPKRWATPSNALALTAQSLLPFTWTMVKVWKS